MPDTLSAKVRGFGLTAAVVSSLLTRARFVGGVAGSTSMPDAVVSNDIMFRFFLLFSFVALPILCERIAFGYAL